MVLSFKDMNYFKKSTFLVITSERKGRSEPFCGEKVGTFMLFLMQYRLMNCINDIIEENKKIFFKNQKGS